MTLSAVSSWRVLLALLFCAAALGHAEQEPEAAAVVVGTGAYRYTWIDHWGSLPDSASLGYTHGKVVIDAAGQVYVETDGERAICVFAPDGSFVRSFGAEWADGLHGMKLVREGEREVLWLTHIRKGLVLKVDLEGHVLQSLAWPAESGLYERAEQYHPTDVAILPTGEILVADGYGRSYVHRYAADGAYRGPFLFPGREAGQLRNPHGLTIAKHNERDYLMVADRENGRVQLFDLAGKLQAMWTEGLRRPCQVQVRGELVAVADIDGGITLLDASGKLLAQLGVHPDAEARDRKDVALADMHPGYFHSPHGLAFAPDGSLFVVEWLEQGRLTKLVPIEAR